ncbi:RdRP-domain-containing protein [Schizopora paradoxa]|uniref:RNA-dependent RNA polymerase n=1 Tax=Schizopora paradoxa TaxID=27342 RepID=A0A0H2RY44_9AGAM|nr:RdRP-domain-containing protein [Schizopora paradoxa]
MEIFMEDIAFSVHALNITIAISETIHGPAFEQFNVDGPVNFDVFIHRKKSYKRGDKSRSYKTGCITFPTEELGARFLDDHRCGRISMILGGRPIICRRSKFSPRPQVLGRIRRTPFTSPEILRERVTMQEEFRDVSEISAVQFGWDCRDDTFSVEWDRRALGRAHISRFDEGGRRLIVELGQDESTLRKESIIITFSQISAAYSNKFSGFPAVFLTLRIPPLFLAAESLTGLQATQGKSNIRRRTSLLDADHARVAPFVSTSMRLVFSNVEELNKFQRNWASSKIRHKLTIYDFLVEKRNLFSDENLKRLEMWMKQLEWPLAFHIHALITSDQALDPQELSDLQPHIDRLRVTEGAHFVSSIIPLFRVELEKQWYTDGWESHEPAGRCFTRILEEQLKRKGPISDIPRAVGAAEGIFNCFHVTITPTQMLLYGPYPERTNRVTRRFVLAADRFLRVNFVDEAGLQLRFDKEVDSETFIKERVGRILKYGITVGGRRFEFLAYSQSALKDHAVWFVTPFWDDESQSTVDAAAIRGELGQFVDNPYDAKLVLCPARFAARMSQAFTSTDMSVTVRADEIVIEPDIVNLDTGYCFTDGIGSISEELAFQIIQKLRRLKRRGLAGDDGSGTPVKAFQIRFRGSKGMVAVNHLLKGKILVLRPSMIKFDAYNTSDIGIASYFARPSRLFLNRPLIMLLEGLGVPCSVFLDFQRKAVQKARDAEHSIEDSRKLLEEYGLGASFRLPSVLQNLASLDCDIGSHFEKDVMKLAVFHVLRELKHRARIPIPGYTLVGVADIHQYLQEGQVFICIQERNEECKYLEGPVLVTRSPVIHPGDVQIAHAIGPPPPGSPFAIEPLQNTVVFSTLGNRPLPSCLGGGDLDGDVYNVTVDDRLHPPKTYPPAGYEPAKRRELDRPSTIDDVADFVVDYIISDNLGVIAKRWMVIADQSDNGIFDVDCMKLSKLHSDAVDYPKTGSPVPLKDIPKDRGGLPDWCQPEIIASGPNDKTYYTSKTALGVLYRDIHLHDPTSRRRKRRRRGRGRQRVGGVDSHLSGDDDDDELENELSGQIDSLTVDEGSVYEAIISRTKALVPDRPLDERYRTLVEDIFVTFASQLEHICASHTLSNRNERLSEVEAILGVISERTSQPRRRKELMSKLREHTAQLVIDIRWEFQMGEVEHGNPRNRLTLALTALDFAIERIREKEFGARSFWWICLGAIFEAIRLIEEGSVKAA